MAFNADSLGLQPAAMTLLRDLIHDRFGVFFEPNRFDILADRLAPLVTERGFTAYLDYFYFLKYDEASRTEWERVADAISVPETYFWREIDQLRAVVDHIVPGLVRRGRAPVRIWSVPCASGEEPLTVAMLLEDAGWFERGGVEIHAADVSPAALARARAGRYRERSLRLLSPYHRAKYFRADGDQWRICESLLARVSSWRRLNLRNPDDAVVVATGDIVLCRNMFIYFSQPAIREVVDCLASRMRTPSYLCIGASESLLRITKQFDLQEIGGAFVYVKASAPTEPSR
jgi:chemotaxis protein methyltransferase CheR